jgi:hypothetical protein
MVQQDSFCGRRAQPFQFVEKRAVRTNEFCDTVAPLKFESAKYWTSARHPGNEYSSSIN